MVLIHLPATVGCQQCHVATAHILGETQCLMQVVVLTAEPQFCTAKWNRLLTKLAITMVSTMTGLVEVPRVNWRPRGGCPVVIS